MIHNGQAATHHEDVFWRSWDSPPPARRPPSLCPRAMLAPTTFTRCRPPSIPQIVSQKDRNGKALKINYETLVRRPTRLMVDRRHWRNVLRAEEVSFCTKPKPSRQVALCHKKTDGTAANASCSVAIPTSLEQYVTLICLNEPYVAIHNERVSLIASEGDIRRG